MRSAEPNHYTTLGLDRDCTAAQIRAAYRALTKRHHPDLNSDAPESAAHTRALNAAHEILSQPARRQAYDRTLDPATAPAAARERGVARMERNIAQDVSLPAADFLRGATLEVRVTDPANPRGNEAFSLVIPPGTAPGARFRLPRTEPFEGGTVTVRVKTAPGFRFKARGSDLRCDLRINPRRATHGGIEMIQGVTGNMVRVQIPPGVGRGAVLRVPGEGLPRTRGGRGDLLVRITYRPEVRITRSSGR